MERYLERGITPMNEVDDPVPWNMASVDSGVGLEAQPTIDAQEFDFWSSSGFPSHWNSDGFPKEDVFLDVPSSQTYQCDLCDESVQDTFPSFDELRRHKETRHETTDHVQRISSPATNEGVPKATNQFRKLSTPPEPSYDSQISSGLSVSPSQKIALSQGNGSPLGSETTDSGDTAMNADEESLFDDNDAQLYTERKWDEATIQRLEQIYKQKLYSLVDAQIFFLCKAHQDYGPSSRSRYIYVPSDRSSVVRKRTRTGCLTCRRRRIKCGEQRPICNNCIRSGRKCEGYTQRIVFKMPLGKFGAYNTNQVLDGLMQPTPSAATEQATSDATGNAAVQEKNLQGRDGTSSWRKRKADEISDEGDHGGPYEGNGDGSQGPSKRFKASKSEDRALRFACPFFKRHPESFRTCGMSDHENSSRIKQHISRKHRMPIYCPRCSATFKTEHERDTHVRDADCPVGPKANFICATAEQLRNLSRRNTHQTDRENWNAIYKILFPDDPLPDSPYLDPLVSYEVNLVREAFLAAAPVAVRTAIQQVIPEEFSDTLQEELERVLRSTHADVFDQILHRMREDREPGRAHRTTTQSLLQTTVSRTPDSGFGSILRSESSQDEPEPAANSQERPTSFGGGSFDLQYDRAIPFLPPLAPEFESSEHRMGYLSQPLPDGAFDDLLEYLDAPGGSSLTDQS